MTSMTNEELDAARAYEAHRLNCGGQFTTVMEAYRHLFVTGWTPALAIDPLVQALTDCGWLGNPEYDADAIRDALAKRGMEIARTAITPNQSISAGDEAKTGADAITPVNPLLLEAREVNAVIDEADGHPSTAKRFRAGEYDETRAVAITIAALKRGMEIAREQDKAEPVSDEQIKHMANRFLAWTLPSDFNPDGGIMFDRIINLGTSYEHIYAPTGTNLLTYTQAEQMVRHMVEPVEPVGRAFEITKEWCLQMAALEGDAEPVKVNGVSAPVKGHVLNEPVAPVPVDRARDILDKICLEWAIGDENEAAQLTRTYLDEHYAEGERAGIEAAIKRLRDFGADTMADFLSRDLIGGADQ